MARKSLNVFGNFVVKEVRFGKIRIAYINWYVTSIWFSRYHLPVIILSSYRRRGGGGREGRLTDLDYKIVVSMWRI